MQGSRVVAANGADANFNNSVLKLCDFSRADLAGGKFMRADLTGSNFDRACLRHSDLREARLGSVNLCRADLAGARMGGAILQACDLRGADLTGARELTSQQLIQARTDSNTILPNGTAGPYRRGFGAERPIPI
jgi:uncharacterized protein YjbI with pentapeptide repeats